jgi:hypothetical protein
MLKLQWYGDGRSIRARPPDFGASIFSERRFRSER